MNVLANLLIVLVKTTSSTAWFFPAERLLLHSCWFIQLALQCVALQCKCVACLLASLPWQQVAPLRDLSIALIITLSCHSLLQEGYMRYIHCNSCSNHDIFCHIPIYDTAFWPQKGGSSLNTATRKHRPRQQPRVIATTAQHIAAKSAAAATAAAAIAAGAAAGDDRSGDHSSKSAAVRLEAERAAEAAREYEIAIAKAGSSGASSG
jgi:hypothetical protein